MQNIIYGMSLVLQETQRYGSHLGYRGWRATILRAKYDGWHVNSAMHCYLFYESR